MHIIMEVLKNSGCLDYIDRQGADALEQIQKRRPEGFAFLNADAAECLRKNYRERMNLIYEQVLIAEVRKKLEKHDPVGLMLGKFRAEMLKEAAEDLMAQTEGRPEEYLHAKYPLLDRYKKQIHDNFIDCFSDFLQAFISKKKECSEKLLGGRTIGTILHLSTGGADIHRNGRCVIGVTTDAGTVYYKPHDCGLDTLYHEIVQKWFSDCTTAADVVAGRFSHDQDGPGTDFAFVSCLKHEPVFREGDIAAFYYHFGILAALFHGLGSNDMHVENIISCADKPAAVDMETVLGTALQKNKESDSTEKLKAMQEVSESLLRTCLLPVRTYKGPLISPMYSCRKDALCLPEYEGQFKTVEGHEKEFIRGFKEGYERMLNHRDDIQKMIRAYQHVTVRCLLRNTSFYYLVRQMLFRPECLTDEKSREKIYEKLCSPYTVYGAEPEHEILRYEWKCLLKGDIPYYCTTASGKDLCGEDPGQIVRKDYYQKSVMDSAGHFLSRLSEEEEVFEEDLLRVVFAHAPTDAEPEKETVPVSEGEVKEERLEEEIAGLFQSLKQDAVRCLDGSLIWISTAESLEMIETFGNLAMFGNAGVFAARTAAFGRFPGIQKEADGLVQKMCLQMDRILEQIEKQEIKEDNLYHLIPTGLYTGLGGVLLACREMEKTGVSKAFGLAERFVQIALQHKLCRYKKINAAEGAAGLLLALTALPQTEAVKALSLASAERLLAEDLPNRADLPYGCAGIGAALAAAYGTSGDIRFRQSAAAAFQKVLDEYKPELGGWPDGSAKLKWMADKGPHAAGIYLAAAYAKEKLADDSEDGKALTEKICNTALESMLKEGNILYSDSVDQGNALTVLALLKAGEKERAGQILSAMLNRKERKGCFTVAPDGIRSTFDPSYYMGTMGIGYAFMIYLNN